MAWEGGAGVINKPAEFRCSVSASLGQVLKQLGRSEPVGQVFAAWPGLPGLLVATALSAGVADGVSLPDHRAILQAGGHLRFHPWLPDRHTSGPWFRSFLWSLTLQLPQGRRGGHRDEGQTTLRLDAEVIREGTV